MTTEHFQQICGESSVITKVVGARRAAPESPCSPARELIGKVRPPALLPEPPVVLPVFHQG